MSYNGFDVSTGDETTNILKLDVSDPSLSLPNSSFIRDAEMTREGADLVLEGPDGVIVIENYFAMDNPPNLVAPDGITLTPQLVNSFAHSQHFAASNSMSDVSPVGTVQEISGEATVTRTNGEVESVKIGTPIYQGDVIETSTEGAVNIVFIDETSFAVSEDARLAIDEFVFDPATNAGTQNFSVLKGVFVFTSGLIGREDPDDVEIETPVGSIGIRGTIIAGNVDTGEITVVEGAIVVRDFGGNEMTLASQFETARLDPLSGSITHIGQMSATDISTRFSSISNVSPSLFSSINDAASENAEDNGGTDAPADDTPDGDTPDDAPEAAADNTGDDNPVDAPETQTDTTTDFGTNIDFGNDDSGLNSETVDGGTDDSGLQTAEQPPTAEGTAAAEPPPPPPGNEPANLETKDDPLTSTTDDSNTVQPPPPPQAPINQAHIPSGYLTATEGTTWYYHFDKEFTDPDGEVGDLTFSLSAASVSILDNLVGTGFLSNWNLNDANGGELTLNFVSDFIANNSFDFDVIATDADGLEASATYHFILWNPTTDISTVGGNTATTSGEIIAETGGATFNIGIGGYSVDANHIYMGDGNDTVNIISNYGNNNYIYLGNGENAISIGAGSTGNEIYGGYSNDTFTISDADNIMYGIDGDDLFLIDLSNTSLLSQLNTAGGDTLINGGFSNFRAAEKLGDLLSSLGITDHHMSGYMQDTAYPSDGHGDSLEFMNVGNIDFTTIDDAYITNIERLDFGNSATNNITMNYTDIVHMTDDRNVLVINLDSNDNLTLSGLSGFEKIVDNVVLNDERSGSTAPTPTTVTYDIYTDGDVTLFIEDGNTNITGLPI